MGRQPLKTEVLRQLEEAATDEECRKAVARLLGEVLDHNAALTRRVARLEAVLRVVSGATSSIMDESDR